MAGDLFSSAASDRLQATAPLAARLRPLRLDEVVGQHHLLGTDKPLRRLIEADQLSSVVLWGPPGVGKTSLARLVARMTSKHFEAMSAVSASVKDIRRVAAEAEQRLGERGAGTILFLDEVHRFSKSQQDALLPHVESGLLVLIGATTENPYFSVNAPLLSRSTLFRLHELDAVALHELAQRGLQMEKATADDDAIDHLVERAEGDARRVLTSLEIAVALATENERHVTLAHAEAALDARALRYGDDEHYDIVSAFIKSIRGSDPDAGIYWLARMLEAGEDPRFIARRLVILASEDVGLADSNGLLVATAAATAVEFVGLPEAQLNLSHAVLYLSKAPKSNSATTAIFAARGAVREQPSGSVPVHLRDAHYSGAKDLGHGVGYVYPHDRPGGYVVQSHMPPELAGQKFYDASGIGEDLEFLPGPSLGRSDTQAADTQPEGEQ